MAASPAAGVAPAAAAMLSNATLTGSGASGLLASAARFFAGAGGDNDGSRHLVAKMMGASAIAAVIALVFQRISTPRLDPREPPILRPRVPFIGHLVGMLRLNSDFLRSLRRPATSNTTPGGADEEGQKTEYLPIATLPILTGYSYGVWSAHLVQQIMRHKNLTFEELGFTFAARLFGIDQETLHRMRGGGEEGHTDEDSPAAKIMAGMKTAMSGQTLYSMNLTAIRDIGKRLNAVGDDGLVVDNVFFWLWDLLANATAEALYGHQNPWRQHPELTQNLWLFDFNHQSLLPGVLPNIIARTAVTNRNILQDALLDFYASRGDEAEDVAAIAKIRAHWSRVAGFTNAEISRLEITMPWVATTNTVPTLYWFFINVFTRPDLVERLRAEVEPLIEMSKTVATTADADSQEEKKTRNRKAVLNIGRLEQDCPLLDSCYRETIRLSNQVVGTRVVKQDAVVTDEHGREYLLKQGMSVIWCTKVLHRDPAAWGADADSFVAERFITPVTPAQERLRKISYAPFGGGKHLCPGRNHALAENLAFVAALLAGFDVLGLDRGGGGEYRMPGTRIAEAVPRPDKANQAGPITIRRRAGWEDVEWGFK